MKKIIALSITAMFALSANSDVVIKDVATSTEVESPKYISNAELAAELKKVQKDLKKANKKIKKLDKKLNAVKAHDAGDNIKFSADFRNSYNNFEYKMIDGSKVTNSSLLTQRLHLGMKAKPLPNLTFYGQLAMYKTWGGNKISSSEPFQNVDWRGSSRPDDSTIKIRQGYFVYKVAPGIAVSVGRRPAHEGFLANMRENSEKPGSPLAHITNMEVDAAMVKVGIEKYISALPGSYIKFVYGRAHDNVNETYSTTPYIYNSETSSITNDDGDVDFIVLPMSLFDNGQYKVMAQYALILNSKGVNTTTNAPKRAAGKTTLTSIGLQVDGVGEEISDFLDSTTLFASVAMSSTDPKDGYMMLASTDREDGYSYWVGANVPDMITDGGKLGVEFNHGSKYWTPMTWAEDTIIGSKIAARGDAYEAYWNLPILKKNLTAQLRYTYIDYDYKSGTICYWEDPEFGTVNTDGKWHGGDVDSAQNFRFSVRYIY